MKRHPAHTIDFPTLHTALLAERDSGWLNHKIDLDTDLHLFTYSRQCVYDHHWNDTTKMARGLIVSPTERRIVATPFPKFFNYSELPPHPDYGTPLLDPYDSFLATVKFDGSLIILFHHANQWRCATKGSFNSRQALTAAFFLGLSTDEAALAPRHHNIDCKYNLSALTPGTTYLLEYIGPTNRIVIPYAHHDLCLIGAYDDQGYELPHEVLVAVASAANFAPPAAMSCGDFDQLLVEAQTLPGSAEGWVVQLLPSGQRFKIKGDEYFRLHRTISGLTPLTVWEWMHLGADLDAKRAALPPEFHPDFDAIKACLQGLYDYHIQHIESEALLASDWTDKELGLRAKTLPDAVRPFIFLYRRTGLAFLNNVVSRRTFFMLFRPTANRLSGYQPSQRLSAVLEDTP